MNNARNVTAALNAFHSSVTTRNPFLVHIDQKGFEQKKNQKKWKTFVTCVAS